MTSRDNTLDPKYDIRGTDVQDSSLDVTQESLQLGKPITGQSGSAASIIVSMSIVSVSGLTGMLADESLGRFITISGSATAANDGTFQITSVLSASMIVINNVLAVTDGNNGSISWVERSAYTLESDINYARSDRANIKGVDFDVAVPDYQRPDATTTDVDASLANIAGKTTDATTVVINELVSDVTITAGDGYVTVSGVFPYTDAVDTLGFPISDGFDAGINSSTFTFIAGDGYESELGVLTGGSTGDRIIGVARQGTSGAEGSSIEVEFRSVPFGDDISTSVAYTWEADQDTLVHLYFGKRERLDLVDDTYLRTEWVNGLLDKSTTGGGGGGGSGTGISATDHASLRQLIHLANGGPFEEFVSGAFREVAGGVFPTSIVWYESVAKTDKIVEKTIVRNANQTPATIEWKSYDEDGSTVLATVTDTITYSGVTETSRTRSVA